jgi:hypothetical protein
MQETLPRVQRLPAHRSASPGQLHKRLIGFGRFPRLPIDRSSTRQSAECLNLTPAKKLLTSATLLRITLPAGEETITAISLPYLSDVTLASFSNVADSIAIFDRSYCC